MCKLQIVSEQQNDTTMRPVNKALKQSYDPFPQLEDVGIMLLHIYINTF